MFNTNAATTPKTPPTLVILVHLRSVRNDVTGQCGWGAIILSGNAAEEQIEQISDLCTAEGPFDADILGAAAVLARIKGSYSEDQLKSVVVYAAKGLCEGFARMALNGGKPTGKPAFRPLWMHLFELAKQTGAIFKRMPTGGPAAEISNRAHKAARRAVGIDPLKQSIGKVACPTPGCGTHCDAYLMKDGRSGSWCQRCREVFFTDSSGEVSSGR